MDSGFTSFNYKHSILSKDELPSEKAKATALVIINSACGFCKAFYRAIRPHRLINLTKFGAIQLAVLAPKLKTINLKKLRISNKIEKIELFNDNEMGEQKKHHFFSKKNTIDLQVENEGKKVKERQYVNASPEVPKVRIRGGEAAEKNVEKTSKFKSFKDKASSFLDKKNTSKFKSKENKEQVEQEAEKEITISPFKLSDNNSFEAKSISVSNNTNSVEKSKLKACEQETCKESEVNSQKIGCENNPTYNSREESDAQIDNTEKLSFYENPDAKRQVICYENVLKDITREELDQLWENAIKAKRKLWGESELEEEKSK